MRDYGDKWTDAEIKDSISMVIFGTGIDHFPTHKEMDNYFGNRALSNRVTKSGGTKRWAKEFNLPLKQCAKSSFGDKYEEQAEKDIKTETGINSKRTTVRYPYDIYAGNGIKIDIKASMPAKGRKFDIWNFNLEKKIPTCDFYIFYCVDNELNIVKRVIVPACVIEGIKQVGIGTLSRYDSYIERWDLIKTYDDFLKEIKSKVEFIHKRRSA